MLVSVSEIWELKYAVCISKRGLSNAYISPLPNGVIVTNTTEFLLFSVPLSGEFTLTGEIQESELLTNKPVDLVTELGYLRSIGITHVSGFSDLSVSFATPKVPITDNTVVDSPSAVLPNTHNTFFARLLKATVGEEVETNEELYYNKVTGQNYNSPTPLVPLKLLGNNVSPVVWNDTELLDLVALPDNTTNTTIRCYTRGDNIILSGLVPGNNYYWVSSDFVLVTEPLPSNAGKTILVGNALSTTEMNLILLTLFED
jgi:hypothetical protein